MYEKSETSHGDIRSQVTVDQQDIIALTSGESEQQQGSLQAALCAQDTRAAVDKCQDKDRDRTNHHRAPGS